MASLLRCGIDLGSTTTKIVVMGKKENKVLFSRYRRHRARVRTSLFEVLSEVEEKFKGTPMGFTLTGSASMGLSQELGIPFIQEVVAASLYVKEEYPQVRTVIEIGGEDSKIIFFDENFHPDIRMNGSCAGGTGSFIDQMAVLLDVETSDLNELANKAKNIYPIASRCGVFAKTDVQALLSRGVSKEDIAASIFHALAMQVITTLARGRRIEKEVMLAGGPSAYFPYLKRAFAHILSLDEKNILIPPSPQLIPAMGATYIDQEEALIARPEEMVSLLKEHLNKGKGEKHSSSLQPLFEEGEYQKWLNKHNIHRAQRISPSMLKKGPLVLGIDSGSTTTKMILIDEEKRIVSSFYTSNDGDPIGAVKKGIKKFLQDLKTNEIPPIAASCVTGYGEELIKAAFGIHMGMVETLAHFKGAAFFEPEVSFILDIGGQDMKAIRIEDGVITDIQVNEACSSGCGSFIETFARSLGYSVEEFAKEGLKSKNPFDLGVRCTVFMNSRVKQALKEGASVADISSGLAYSVIKNALYKVLKLKDTRELGEKIVAQGGTFKNPLVLRALEKVLGKDVIRPDISELMGAFGAAITALERYQKDPSIFSPLSLEEMNREIEFSTTPIHCKGCENRCEVLKLTFDNGNTFYTGNRCERIFGNHISSKERGINLLEKQLKLIFERKSEPSGPPILTYGIPRALNMYENFPFWCTLLTSLGFKVVLSSPSNFKMYEKGISTVMSENICFPAKMVHGHIMDLIEKGVDRILYPMVVFEEREHPGAFNSFNCPVVTGYPDLIKSAIDPLSYGIPLDIPAISFKNQSLLKDQLYLFFKKFGVKYQQVARATEKALSEQKRVSLQLREMGEKIIKEAKRKNKQVVVICGRPYHIDPFINHGIANLLANMGVYVLSERALPFSPADITLEDTYIIPQWAYSNRLYAAAKWVSSREGIEMVHITSFGCGPDAVNSDEIKRILREKGKLYTLIKMDDITNLGAVKIRLRSLLESLKERKETGKSANSTYEDKICRVYLEKDRKRTLIAPYFSPFYSPLIPYGFRPLGYKVEILPPQSRASVEWGLKVINHDMCYPAHLVAGDIVWAFKSNRYNPEDTAVILIQSGGQCRASNYVALIRKALASMGYEDVPVVAISNDEINPQPGFDIDIKGLMKRMAYGMVFADALARLYLATVPREKIKGVSKQLHTIYLHKIGMGVEKADFGYLLEVLTQAVEEFNRVEIEREEVPRIGVVGEIFVKYNFFSNGNIIDWLISQGVEVVLPPIQNFFAQRFINETYDQRALFKRSFKDFVKHIILELYTKYYLNKIEKIMEGFRFNQKTPGLRELAEITEQVVSLANQYGEGWLLPAEMIAMLKRGVYNIVCIQPFGCISNHITGKGIEGSLKKLFPQLNLLALDMDAGISEVNILNRLHFMVRLAREQEEIAQVPAKKWHRIDLLPKIWLYDLRVINNQLGLDLEKWKSWMWRIRMKDMKEIFKKLSY